MKTYRAEMPWRLSPDDIEDLRGLGSVEFVFYFEAESRREAIATLGDAYAWRGLDRSWWEQKLSGRRER